MRDEIVRSLRRGASAFGLDIRKAASNRESTSFYPQVGTCQIPNLWLLQEVFLGRRHEGFFVETGGYDGVTHSNSWGLARRDWTGLLVEPVPKFANMARKNHLQHPRVQVLEVACGGESESVAMEIDGPFSKAIDVGEQASMQTLTVRSVPLVEALAMAGLADRPIDFLSIDVEGGELAVVRGIPDLCLMPTMIVVEAKELSQGYGPHGIKDAATCVSLLLSWDYQIVYKDTINTVFVDRANWSRFYSRD